MLLEVGLRCPGLCLLLLAALLHEVLLILLRVLVRVVVVRPGVGLGTAAGQRQAEDDSEQQEAGAGRFHGLTNKSDLAEWYTQNVSFAFPSNQVRAVSSEAGQLRLPQQKEISWTDGADLEPFFS